LSREGLTTKNDNRAGDSTYNPSLKVKVTSELVEGLGVAYDDLGGGECGDLGVGPVGENGKDKKKSTLSGNRVRKNPRGGKTEGTMETAIKIRRKITTAATSLTRPPKGLNDKQNTPSQRLYMTKVLNFSTDSREFCKSARVAKTGSGQ